jgi:uncharacterized protein YecA (UPF0149 family)
MEGLKEIETEGYLPVLAVTAHPAHKLRALQCGAKDFMLPRSSGTTRARGSGKKYKKCCGWATVN